MSTAVDALAAVLRNRDLRRIELAAALGLACEYSSWVAILVYAYRNGGATEAGIIAAVQLVPTGLLVPLAGVAADRIGGAAAFAAGFVLQCAAAGCTAVALLSGAPS